MHGSKKCAPAGIRETKVEVTKDELSKLMSVGTELANEIQEIKTNWIPKSDDKNKENKENDKNKDKKGKKGGKKKDVNEVDAEESLYYHNGRPLAEPLQPRAPARAVAVWCCGKRHTIPVGRQ